MPKNMSRMRGTKLITPPTPSMRPEITSDRRTPSGRWVEARRPSQAKIPSIHATGRAL